ncbi:hypothetical protein DNTS_007084, partial [Danionella cerebrum]
RSLVEDRASTMSVNISVPDDERSLVEDRASIMSVNISVLMMSFFNLHKTLLDLDCVPAK